MRYAIPAWMLLFITVGIAFLPAGLSVGQEGFPVNTLPPRAVPWSGLDEHLSWSAATLATSIPCADWPYVRFISWNGVPKEKLEDFKKLFSWWIHQMSFKKGCYPPYDVNGSEGRLQWIDIRSYGWNQAAWQAVAEREPFTHEEQGVGTGAPTFLKTIKGCQLDAIALADKVPTVAEFTRKAIGYEVGSEQVKKDRFPVVGMVWGPWLLRETIESDRSPSYYDLLFAQDRFVAGGKVKKTRKVTKTVGAAGGIDPDGRTYPPGYQYQVDEEYEDGSGVKFVDFPANKADWEKAFGIDVIKKFIKDKKIDLDVGAVVEGGQDFPEKGSIVSLHNRLITVLPIPTGASLETFDVAETSGKRDYVEQAPKLPFGDITFDAGELLAYLPNGGQAALLVNAAGKRLETADNRFADDSSVEGTAPGDPKKDRRVRTPGSCVICHAPSGGFILPRNAIEELFKAGLDLKIKNKEERDRVEAFYLGWEAQVEAYTRPYNTLVKKTTGWESAALAGKMLAFRNWYDAPVSVDQAAAEMGLEVGAFKALAVKSPKARLGSLVLGQKIPRRSWEIDACREAGLLLAAQQK